MEIHRWHQSGGEQSRGGPRERPAQNPCCALHRFHQLWPSAREPGVGTARAELSVSNQPPGNGETRDNGQISNCLEQLGYEWLQRTL